MDRDGPGRGALVHRELEQDRPLYAVVALARAERVRPALHKSTFNCSAGTACLQCTSSGVNTSGITGKARHDVSRLASEVAEALILYAGASRTLSSTDPFNGIVANGSLLAALTCKCDLMKIRSLTDPPGDPTFTAYVQPNYFPNEGKQDDGWSGVTRCNVHHTNISTKARAQLPISPHTPRPDPRARHIHLCGPGLLSVNLNAVASACRAAYGVLLHPIEELR